MEKTEPQAHGGALNRGGRKRGSRNVRLPALREVAKPTHLRKAWGRLVKLAASEDEAVALRAVSLMLAYGFGRPVPLDPADPVSSAEARDRVEDLFCMVAAAVAADKESERLRTERDELRARLNGSVGP